MSPLPHTYPCQRELCTSYVLGPCGPLLNPLFLSVVIWRRWPVCVNYFSCHSCGQHQYVCVNASHRTQHQVRRCHSCCLHLEVFTKPTRESNETSFFLRRNLRHVVPASYLHHGTLLQEACRSCQCFVLAIDLLSRFPRVVPGFQAFPITSVLVIPSGILVSVDSSMRACMNVKVMSTVKRNQLESRREAFRDR